MNKAKELLTGDLTCVLCRDELVYTSQKTGISPMLDWLSAGTDLRGFCAADKIVGKAAALLFVLAGVCCVHGCVMSRAAKEVFDLHNIPCSYDVLTDHIINRQGDGICPMEQTVLQISDPKDALNALLKKREELIKKAAGA